MSNTPQSYVVDRDIVNTPIPANGILSQTLWEDDNIKILLFAFDTGQELSQHTASIPAIIHIIKGEATVGFGDAEPIKAAPGFFGYMQAQLPHSVYALSPMLMVLQMMKIPA